MLEAVIEVLSLSQEDPEDPAAAALPVPTVTLPDSVATIAVTTLHELVRAAAAPPPHIAPTPLMKLGCGQPFPRAAAENVCGWVCEYDDTDAAESSFLPVPIQAVRSRSHGTKSSSTRRVRRRRVGEESTGR